MKTGSIASALTATLMTVAVTACSSNNAGADPAGGLGPPGSPITIGAVKGLTGSLSSFDGPPTLAAQFAVDDINRRGGIQGHPFKLIKVDTQSDVSHDQQATLQAINQGAQFIIAPCDFDTGAPVAIVAQQKQIVAMSDCAGAPEFGKQGIGPYAFTMGLAAPSEGAGLAQFAVSKHWLRGYVLRDTTLEYHKQVTNGFLDRFKELGGVVVGQDTFQSTDNSIATQLNRLRGAGPIDFVLLMSFPPGGASALRQIRAAGITAPILASNSFDGDYWKSGVPDVSNVYYTNYSSLAGDDPDRSRTALLKRYQAATGKLPDNTNIVTGYSVVQAYQLAVESCGCLNGPKLVAALEALRNAPLVVGPTTFTDKLHLDPTRPMLLMQIQRGRSSFLAQITLTEPPALQF